MYAVHKNRGRPMFLRGGKRQQRAIGKPSVDSKFSMLAKEMLAKISSNEGPDN
jgi:hypothetical protein